MTEPDNDEQFYRDTESIAFPKLDDRQLAMLEPLGSRRVLRRGEMLFKAGQRDLGLTPSPLPKWRGGSKADTFNWPRNRSNIRPSRGR